MNGLRLGRTIAVVGLFALAGCSKASDTSGMPDCAIAHVCGSATPAPASEIPPQHRSTAEACGPTPADAMIGWIYDATGRSCTSDAQCTSDGGLQGHCLHGACTADDCLTDDDCAGGGVCLCSSPHGSSAMWNKNTCTVRGNCRVDADCGAGGYCVPSAGVCGIEGFFCHTSADTCVDPAMDCQAPCQTGGSCTYFREKGAFACSSVVCGGC